MKHISSQFEDVIQDCKFTVTTNSLTSYARDSRNSRSVVDQHSQMYDNNGQTFSNNFAENMYSIQQFPSNACSVCTDLKVHGHVSAIIHKYSSLCSNPYLQINFKFESVLLP